MFFENLIGAREWWNGRHVRLRGVCESVGVQVPPRAPFPSVLEPTRWVGLKGISFPSFSLKFKFSFPGPQLDSRLF